MSDIDYGHVETGAEHDGLSELHHDAGDQHDYQNQFGVYEQDHHAAEDTDYAHGSHQEFSAPSGEHAESDDYTNYSHSANVDDHVFAAEGSEAQHDASFDNLDALERSFDANFANSTQFHQDGPESFGIASS